MLLGCGKRAHYVGSVWWWKPCSLYGDCEAKREARRGWGLVIPFKGTPPVTSLPATRSHLLKVPPPSNSAVCWGPSL
jgi:hypothetical protein